MDIPKVVFVFITDRCNLKCIQCDFHKNVKNHNEISITEKMDIISQIKLWNKDIRLSFTGGEPFIKKNELFMLVKKCKDNDLKCTITTNGTLVNDDDINKILDIGLDNIIISMDSSEEKVHNFIRGDDDSFAKTVSFSKKIISRRDDKNSNLKIYVSSVLGNHNLSNIENDIKFFHNIGFDGMFFEALQPNFGNNDYDSIGWHKENALYPNQLEVENGIKSILSFKEKGYQILQSQAQLLDMIRYFKDPTQNVNKNCRAMYDTMIIDTLGEVKFCFDMKKLRESSLGNIREKDIRSIWEDSYNYRTSVERCSYGCGIKNSNFQ